MNIIVDDIHSTIQTSDCRVLALVKEVCRAHPSGYVHMPRYRSGMWDGYITLMRGMNKFPTGLLNHVVDAIRSHGYPNVHLEFSSKEKAHCKTVGRDFLNGITLRDYQLDAIEELLQAGRGVAKMATNSGKTEVISALVKCLNRKALIVVHRKELLYQTIERIKMRTGFEVGMVGDGIWRPTTVTVGMIQSLHSNLEKLGYWKNNAMLIVDECHHVSSDQMMDVLNIIPGAYRFGFSGTPLKLDVLSDMKLVAMTGDIVFDIGNKYLVEEGYSAVPNVHITVMQQTDEDLWKLDYQSAYRALIVDSKSRNDCIADIAKRAEGTTLIIVNYIEHGEKLSSMIAGSIFVNGSDTSKRRLDVLEAMKSGSGGVYIATNIVDEGIDVPAINNLIIACGGKAKHKLLQRIGRGMRKKDNAGDCNIVHIYDFLDDTNKYLLDHAELRIDVYCDEGFKVELL